MTDYKEEQQNEIEALESIYPEEFKVISESPPCFQIDVASEETPPEKVVDGEEAPAQARACLQFTYVENYPDEVPLIEILTTEELAEDEVNELDSQLRQQAEEELGMVMVFTLVSLCQEFLDTAAQQAHDRKEYEKKREEREEEQRQLAKTLGTQVTLETFTVWKTNFDMERLAKLGNKAKLIEGKLTGRQLFEKDKDLWRSDLAFLEGEVKVDESLFQDMDDLDLDEEFGDEN